jgi:hypothetical protein
MRFRIVAPSAQGAWTMHLENEGARWLRVPADVRLIHLTLESGDTMAKRPPKPMPCTVPAGLRPEGFPERSALVLGPGDAYEEAFDPRLFCFGKAAKALEGGAIVRATYGWDAPRRQWGPKKVEPPFAVEGTVFPAAVEPKKQLLAPTLVLSWLPPDEEDEASASLPTSKPPEGEAEDGKNADESEGQHENPSPVHPPVDENAPRLEVTASPYVDAPNGYKVAVTLTVTNVGHRSALAAIRSRMVAFRIEGPDGAVRCHAAPPTRGLPRTAYQPLKPGASTALTLLVEEACEHDLFRRPGLYQVMPSLHLNESGAEVGLTAMTGVFHAPHPTLVRIADGPEPFAKRPPEAVRAAPANPPVEGDGHGGG